MKVPGSSIARVIEHSLKSEVLTLKKKGKKHPHLVTILVGDSPEQLSFVSVKQKTARRLGIKFDFVHVKKVPSFVEFANLLKKYSADPHVTGILIQLPLPALLQTDTMYNYIPTIKEIEGHKIKTPFCPPIGLAILTVIKYIYGNGKVNKTLLVNREKDKILFKNALKNKKIVIAGRGMTGGLPIGKCFSNLKINYIGINSHTYNPQDYYRDADMIITATGKEIITPDMVKPGAILINVGIRKERGVMKGDYDEKAIEKIAGYYTPTPGGVGPIDVIYLFHNVIESAKMQS
ncbi:bifunctional 5,10-methylenetetrahydrofolate dehydrogenase/5,10-methenyltetrahydrofolate cyclohydrolase [Candidatus Roizmanbacteria bacterium]|nr:bifunctional 5,10-methylenetetrahydrofolate dehydrogenase/5,10-methenyltetrahydrofolate cyclohydrolase [Candidatus Roizmanbacteria bacterium]